MNLEEARKQAYLLAKEHFADEDISEIYWFPNDTQVRLLFVTTSKDFDDSIIIPFFFDASPKYGLPLVTVIQGITPRMIGMEVVLGYEGPHKWGKWEDAVKITREDI